MPALLDILSRLEAANVEIDQFRCVRVRNRNASCRRCADACVSGCIGYVDNELAIAAEKCIGCATCASACPTDALRPKKPIDAELHSSCVRSGKSNNARVVVACQDMLNAADGLFDSNKVAAVACLGRVDLSMLVHLAAEGARGIVLVKGACGACQNARGMLTCEEVVASANILLETWNSPATVTVSEKLPAYVRAQGNQGYDQSKRAFFLSAKDEAKDVAQAAADVIAEDALGIAEEEPSRFVHVDKNGTLPHAMSVRRSILLRSLEALEARYGEPADIMIDTRMCSEAIIDTNICKACRMCATFCPTGANFKFKTKDGRIGVKHRVRECVNCRLCLDICPSGALSFSEEVFARDISQGVVERFVLPSVVRDATKEDMCESLKGQFSDGGKFVTCA